MTDKQRTLFELTFAPRALGSAWSYDHFERLMKARRYAARYHRLCEMACNGEGIFADGDEDQQELAYEQIEIRFLKLFNPDGADKSRHLFAVEFQRDPRGWEISLKHIPTDTDLSQWLYARISL